MSIHFIVRFEPLPGKEAAFREELLRVNEPSRAEPGCLSIEVFESLREPPVFAVHSEWVDEASLELHATLPHTVQFLAAAETLLGIQCTDSGCVISVEAQAPDARDAIHLRVRVKPSWTWP